MADAIAARKGREAERLLTAHIDRNQELLLEVIGADPTEEDE
jgi:DNA-binding GntR family transcriptional regulator